MIEFEDRRDELLEQIEEMIVRKQYAPLRDLLIEIEPADIASLFEDLNEEQVPILFRLLPKGPAAEVFVELEPESQEMLIRGFSNTELRKCLTSCTSTMRSISWRRCPRMLSIVF